jgi:hypothetical protein
MFRYKGALNKQRQVLDSDIWICVWINIKRSTLGPNLHCGKQMGLGLISGCHEHGLRADLIFCTCLTFPLLLPCGTHKEGILSAGKKGLSPIHWTRIMNLQWFHECPCNPLQSFFIFYSCRYCFWVIAPDSTMCKILGTWPMKEGLLITLAALWKSMG